MIPTRCWFEAFGKTVNENVPLPVPVQRLAGMIQGAPGADAAHGSPGPVMETVWALEAPHPTVKVVGETMRAPELVTTIVNCRVCKRTGLVADAIALTVTT